MGRPDARRTTGARAALTLAAIAATCGLGALAGCSDPAPAPVPTAAAADVDPTASPAATDPDVGDEAFPDMSAISCAPTRGRWTLSATLTNPGTDQVTYTVTPTVDTAEGVVLGTATETVVVGPRSARPVTVKDFAVEAEDPGTETTCTIRAVKTTQD